MKINFRAIIPLILLCQLTAPLVITGVYAQDTSQKITHKIYRLSHRPADSLVDIIKIYMSKDGIAVTDARTNSLIVKDYPDNLAKISEIIKEMDIPLPQVRIYLSFLGNTNANSSGIFGSATKTKNGWVVNASPDFSSSKSSNATTMNLAVLSDSDGFIKMGERVPYVTWFYDYCMGRRYVAKGVIFQEVTTGFFVSPRVRDDGIYVRVAPGIYYFDGRNKNKIIFREVETEVFLKDGQSMVVGVGESGKSGSVGLISRIVGAGTFSQDEVFSMEMTVKLIKGQ